MKFLKCLLLLAMFTPACSNDDCAEVTRTPMTEAAPSNATAVDEAFWASCPDGCTLESNGTCCWCPGLK
jgi:hypothetical protein